MLSPRQEKFCLEYAANGNASKAYKIAGFQTTSPLSSAAAANRLLKQPNVAARLKEIAEEIKSNKIADVIECQEVLTAILRDESNETADRIKACQLLLKVQGAFTTKLEFSTTPVVIAGGDLLED